MSNVLLTITWLLRQTIVKGHTELYPYPTNELVNYVACVCVNFRHLYICSTGRQTHLPGNMVLFKCNVLDTKTLSRI